MLTFTEFSGINNALPSYRLSPQDLRVADNVDIGLSGDISRRNGLTSVTTGCWKDLWRSGDAIFGTDGGDLLKFSGGAATTILESVGPDRMWFCDFPDGRVGFSNGLISGITDGTTTTGWGIPFPADVGAASGLSGDLAAGEYRWAVTYARIADGLEGGPTYSAPFQVMDGGIFISSIPMLPGYVARVYLSDGEEFFLAGTSTNGSFSFLGKNNLLVLPLATAEHYPMPAGILPTLWRGRVLVAKDNILWASLPYSPEACDMSRDFKQFEDRITLVSPVDEGIYVGTTNALFYLAGDQFDKLERRIASTLPTVLGSGVLTDADKLKTREGGNFRGAAMICINGGNIVFGYNGGSVWRITEGRYSTEVAEVSATARMMGDYPQYLAVPR